MEDRADDPIPVQLVLAFVVVMTLAVTAHLAALLIASFFLPVMDVIWETGDGEYMDLSPHSRLPLLVETAWILSNVIGILLFMTEVILMAWIKFWYLGQGGSVGQKAATAVTVLLSIAILLFTAHGFFFYKTMVRAIIARAEQDVDSIERHIDHVSRIWRESGVFTVVDRQQQQGNKCKVTG